MSEDKLLSSGAFADVWEQPRHAVQAMAKLENDWDGHGSSPIGPHAIRSALAVLDAASHQRGCEFGWAKPTSDETILMQLSLPRGVELKFEIDRDGDIGAMTKRPGQEPDFTDLVAEQVEAFFSEQADGTRD